MKRVRQKAGCWCCAHFVQSEYDGDFGICTDNEPDPYDCDDLSEGFADAIRRCDEEPCLYFDYDKVFDEEYEVTF